MIIINLSEEELPCPKELDTKELQRMYRLQQRSTLPFFDEKRHLEPLGDEERAELDGLELRWNDRRPPRWGPITFKFRPYGVQGCAFDLRYDVVQCLMTIHPKRLKALRDESELPDGVKALRLKRYPSNQDMTPCSTELEGREIAMVLQEGSATHVRVKESGWAGAAGGPSGGSEGGSLIGGGGGVSAHVPGVGGGPSEVGVGSADLEF